MLKDWLDSHSEEKALENASGIAFVIKCVIVSTNFDPHELETIFTRGRFHPIFFIVLKELFADKGPVFIQKHFGKTSGWLKSRIFNLHYF